MIVDKIDLTQIFNTPSVLFLVIMITIIKTVYNSIEKKQKVIDQAKTERDEAAFKKLEDSISALEAKNEELYAINRKLLESDLKIMFHGEIDNYRKEIKKRFNNFSEEVKKDIEQSKDHVLKNIKHTKELMEESLLRKHNEIHDAGEKYIKIIKGKAND